MTLTPASQGLGRTQQLRRATHSAPRARHFFPREHGAYVVLIGSWAVGSMLVNKTDVFRSGIALAWSLSLFLIPNAYARLKEELKADIPNVTVLSAAVWIGVAALLLTISAFKLSPALVRLLLPAAALSAAFSTLKAHRARLATLSTTAFALLALAAPATSMLNGSDDRELTMLSWILCAGFFCGSSLNVAIRLKGRHAKLNGAIFHTSIIAIWLFIAGGFPCFAAGLVGFGLNATRYLWIILNETSYRGSTLKRIGVQETLITILWTVSVILPNNLSNF